MKILKSVAIAEGISFLLLLLVTWPIKAFLGIKEPNLVVGMAHGVLFIAYCILVVKAHVDYKWDLKKTILALFLSLVPLGTFWAEKKLFIEN
ncbi:MAG: DUF3817 domain-containing protein [Cytophagales bacterium]